MPKIANQEFAHVISGIAPWAESRRADTKTGGQHLEGMAGGEAVPQLLYF